MPKRTICIQNRAILKTKNKSLLITTETNVVSIPYEDIWVIILESQEIIISSSVLASLADAGVGVMVCSKNHMPNSLFLPIGAHSRHASIVENQLSMSKPLCKQIWKNIVVQKIENQARVLDILELNNADKLYALASDVKSGDTTNREAVAAVYYFNALIPNGNRRNSSEGLCLDYGYAILRAGIARSAVAGGWLVSQGLHHSNELNAFNLVDDLIEPFRPLVDLIVFKVIKDYRMTPQTKYELAKLFEYIVLIDGKKYSLQTAIDELLDSLKRSVKSNDSSFLKLPVLNELEMISKVVDR